MGTEQLSTAWNIGQKSDKEIEDYNDENGYKTYTNLRDTMNVVLRCKFIALSASIRN